MASIANLSVRLTASTEALSAGLSRAQALVNGFAKGVGSGAAAAAGGLASVASALNPIAGMAAEGATSMIRLAASAEQTQIAFSVLLGDATKAKLVLGDIAAFASETPFGSAELIDAARQLTAYGTGVDQLLPSLRGLGDVAAATQTPIGDLAYLYGTLQTQGKAFSRDIYQFAGRGIPIQEELAKVLGVQKYQIMQLVEEGKVGFPQVVEAFNNMTGAAGKLAGTDFGGAIAKSAGVADRDLVKLIRTGQLAGSKLADALSGAAAGGGGTAISALANEVGVAESAFLDLVRTGKLTGDQLAGAFVAATRETGRYSGMMEKQSQSLAGLWESLKDNAVLAFTDLGTMIAEALDLKGITRELTSVTAAFRANVGVLRPVFQTIGTLVQFALNGLRTLFEVAKSGYEVIGAALTKAFPDLAPTIGRMGKDFRSFMESLRNSPFDAVAFREGLIEAIRSVGNGFIQFADVVKQAGLSFTREFVVPVLRGFAKILEVTESAYKVYESIAPKPEAPPPPRPVPNPDGLAVKTDWRNMQANAQAAAERAAAERAALGPLGAMARLRSVSGPAMNPFAEARQSVLGFATTLEGTASKVDARLDLSGAAMQRWNSTLDDVSKGFRNADLSAKQQTASDLVGLFASGGLGALSAPGVIIEAADPTGLKRAQGKLKAPNEPPADLRDEATRLKLASRSPMQVFMERLNQLNAMKGWGLFEDNMTAYAKAVDSAVLDLEKASGLGELKQPEALIRGTREAESAILSYQGQVSSDPQERLRATMEAIRELDRVTNIKLDGVVRAIEKLAEKSPTIKTGG